MGKVVILSNHHAYTYNFRKEIIQRLITEKFKVYIICPYGEKIEYLKEMGCEYIDIPLDRRGINPITDFKLLLKYNKLIKKINPSVVLGYTIKPNIYGSLICKRFKIPFIANITGLGTAVEKESLIQRMLIFLYRIAFNKVGCIFFQNSENQQFFIENNIGLGKHKIIPGSGVNIDYFNLLDYPSDKFVEFIFVSRIMKEKGIDQYLEAADYIRDKYPDTRFHVLGFCEDDYEEKLKMYQDKGVIQYHGMQSDVREFHKISHCTIHPTYYPEGMSNVLLESAACGRPIITTNRSGCREIVDNGVNGYIIEQQNSKDLIKKIEQFLELSYLEKMKMGLAGRVKVESEFDRNIVVEAYLTELDRLSVSEKKQKQI